MQKKLLTVFYLLSLLIYGLMASYAMAPTNMWFLLFVSLSASYVALSQLEKPWQGFLAGWLFGFGYFVGGLHWIANALLVEGNPYAWAWPLAAAGLPALLAVFPALAFYLSKKLLDLKKVTGFLGFVALLFISEILRGTQFSGFPWNLYGYAWADILPMAQIVSIGTIYLLTGLTIIWATFPGYLLLGKERALFKTVFALLIASSIAGNYAFGVSRMSENSLDQKKDNIVFRLVQPNIIQSEKWDRSKMYDHFVRHLSLSLPDETDSKDITTIIVWPETAISPYITENPSYMDQLTELLTSYEGDVYLFTGALRYLREDNSYRNSIILFNKEAQVQAVYDKHHLVPFGEYIPFQKWIPIPTVTQFSGFAAGEEPEKIAINEKYSALPLICYEIIFPELTHKKEDVTFIVNVTNDAWYGNSAGPRQHLTKAIFRAIETGKPLIRAAGTGISGVINPYGRIVKTLEYGSMQSISY